jgi:hypothetical protein
MLDSSYRNRENAIEEVVYDFLKDCEPVEMTQETAETFIMIGMMPKDVKLSNKTSHLFFRLWKKERSIALLLDLQTKGLYLLSLFGLKAQEGQFFTFGTFRLGASKIMLEKLTLKHLG